MEVKVDKMLVTSQVVDVQHPDEQGRAGGADDGQEGNGHRDEVSHGGVENEPQRRRQRSLVIRESLSCGLVLLLEHLDLDQNCDVDHGADDGEDRYRIVDLPKFLRVWNVHRHLIYLDSAGFSWSANKRVSI